MLRWALLLLVTSACTTGKGGDPVGDTCDFGDDYLPYEPGNHWSWRVVELRDGAQSTKTQVIEEAIDDPDLGTVLVQRTTKSTGMTVSYFDPDPSVLLRRRQEDFDELGALQRTTDYMPGQLRLDQGEAGTAVGATWDEEYTAIVSDPDGVELSRTDRVDRWEVLGTDVECTAPLGTFLCLHVRRQRIVGGSADKQYYFARGIGKVREVGSKQIEELVGCERE